MMRPCCGANRYFSTTVATSFFKKFYQNVVDVAPKEFVVQDMKRPVGLKSPPTASTVYPRGNSFRDLFDREKTDRRSKELGVEFSKSGMYDIHIFRKTNGKLFHSPPSFWRADKSLYFPHIVGSTLNGDNKSVEEVLKGKVSVVRIFSSEVGDELSKQYTQNQELDLDYIGKDMTLLGAKGIQIVDVNFADSGIKYLLMKLFTGRLKTSVPPELYGRYFLADREQLPFTIREALQINNVFTGFTIVVDPHLKIRWMASGGASTEEFKTLWKCAKGVRKESLS